MISKLGLNCIQIQWKHVWTRFCTSNQPTHPLLTKKSDANKIQQLLGWRSCFLDILRHISNSHFVDSHTHQAHLWHCYYNQTFQNEMAVEEAQIFQRGWPGLNLVAALHRHLYKVSFHGGLKPLTSLSMPLITLNIFITPLSVTQTQTHTPPHTIWWRLSIDTCTKCHFMGAQAPLLLWVCPW